MRNCAYLEKFAEPKIIWKQTSSDKTFAYDDDKHFLDVSGQMLTNGSNKQELKYLLACLHSKVCDSYIRATATAFGEKGTRWIPQFVENLPVPKIDKRSISIFETLVDAILAGKAVGKDTSAEEAEIDARVFKLYGLTEADMRTVLESLPTVSTEEQARIVELYRSL